MNVPNILSMIRLLLVPLFGIIFFGNGANAHQYAVLVYAVATLTDVLDGYIARKYNLITKLGRVLDPLADKLMGFMVLLCITIDGIVPWWAVAVFVLKEGTMGIGAVVMYGKVSDIMSSNLLGKSAAAVFFSVCVILIMFENKLATATSTLLISVALLLTFSALLKYIDIYVKFIKESESK